MSLTSALRIAQSSLFSSSLQTSVVSRNISEVGNLNYARRDAELVSTSLGASVMSIRRTENLDLLRDSLSALSSSVGQSVISVGASRLNNVINGVDNATSPATFLTRFENSLQLYSTDPSNNLTGEQVVYAAKELAIGISDASMAVQSYRGSLDGEIVDDVARVNNLLAQFEELNNEVTRGTAIGENVNDALDARDAILKDLSKHISITTVSRSNNDQLIYTAEGVTLFETQARAVTFDPTANYAPGVTGNPIYVDGVPLTPGSGASTDAVGSLSAKLQLRDDVAQQVQGQLDEVARALIVQFAETDQTGGGAPPLAGLFTHSGGPAVPTGATGVDGIALSLSVNGLFDPVVGGNPQLLRDGGANGAAYIENTAGGASFSNRLISFVEAIDATVATDPSFGLSGTYSVSGYAQASIGWLDSIRSTASRASDSKAALSDRLTSMLSADTGVNLDEELSMLIELEQSYQASARIISTVDNMYASLFQATL